MRLLQVVGACVVVVLLGAIPTLAARTERVSVSTSGEQAMGGSGGLSISADGRFVAFVSVAGNLVPEDRNGVQDIFVRDRVTSETERVSVSSDGEEANERSYPTEISGDGRFVAFQSYASNLAPGDANGGRDVFVRDRETGVTELVSVNDAGEQVDDEAVLAGMSSDGRFVLFRSLAGNLGCGGVGALFLRDRLEGTTEAVSVSASGAVVEAGEGAVSGDGRFVAFVTGTSNVTPGDDNGMPDVYVRDRMEGTTELVSVDNEGRSLDQWSGRPAISADGRFVAFDAFDFYLEGRWPAGPAQVYVRDLEAGTTELVSVWIGDAEVDPVRGSFYAAISPDGRYVAFCANARNLVPGDTNDRMDVFVRDRQAGTTTRVSVSTGGVEGNHESSYPAISADGQVVAFDSLASNLVPDDDNAEMDAFVRDLGAAPSFADVPEEHWAWEAVAACAGARIVSGYADGLYHPERVVPRDQMAVFIARALTGGDGYVPEGPERPTFLDVPQGHWAYRHVEECATEDVVRGVGTVGGYPIYEPALVVTRGQMAVFVARGLAGGEAGVAEWTGAASFADVDAESSAFRYVEYLAARGIVAGYPDGLYHPERECTRDQMAVFLWRAFLEQ